MDSIIIPLVHASINESDRCDILFDKKTFGKSTLRVVSKHREILNCFGRKPELEAALINCVLPGEGEDSIAELVYKCEQSDISFHEVQVLRSTS